MSSAAAVVEEHGAGLSTAGVGGGVTARDAPVVSFSIESLIFHAK
jgi:hypothetical protein